MARQRESIVEVKAGLYALRYESGPSDGVVPPLIRVTILEKSSSSIQLISDPFAERDVLRVPGTCLVVLASSAGRIRLVAIAETDRDPLDAFIKLERLGSAPRNLDRAAAEAGEFQLLGHLARRGDVAVEAGEWIGGPDFPLPIEGIEIRNVSRGMPLDLDYQVLSGAPQPRWTEWSSAGEFAGSRGRSHPLRGVRLRLGGTLAQTERIEAKALFLGAPVMDRCGREVELIGSGQDPLVGLSLRLAKDRGVARRTALNFAHEISTFNKPKASGGGRRVRIFRASDAELGAQREMKPGGL